MIRFLFENGSICFEDAAATVRLLQNEQTARLNAQAEQAALSAVYCLSGKHDSNRPYGGLLTERLNISERAAYDLLRTGKIRYTRCGAKGYRISELAVRQFLGDKPQN